MTNWRGLPAGDELDRVIAERLGWHIVSKHTPHNPVYPENEIQTFSPDGKIVHSAYYTEMSLDSCLEHMQALHKLPRYSRDVNTELPLDEGYYWTFTSPTVGEPDDNWLAEIINTWTGEHESNCAADTLPLARAHAWLAWMDNREAY